jgi:hypothetical protein
MTWFFRYTVRTVLTGVTAIARVALCYMHNATSICTTVERLLATLVKGCWGVSHICTSPIGRKLETPEHFAS